ncbi:metallophosphoesterase family protein [Bacillus sp. PK3_68]|uniref:metallophosphoesterase family protein n=1 Tax=Bacillus sp. PK3_68 TaxID=2027408 RepID=UPI00217CE4E5|nr:metallophosphoesterase family protein [Bacillus sp. PK3_68]
MNKQSNEPAGNMPVFHRDFHTAGFFIWKKQHYSLAKYRMEMKTLIKIAVLSDTHLPKKGKQLPEIVMEGIQDADLILHAGDWTSLDVYEQLREIAPVIGVFGNVDPPEVKDVFEEKRIIEAGRFRIGITHGHIGKKKKTPERAWEAFQQEELDAIVFGHSHIPYSQMHDDTLLFNPGSPTDKRFQPRFSYGIIEIGEALEAKHIYF